MVDQPQLRDLSPPGEILAEALEERSMTHAELARRTELSEKHVSQLVNARVPMSLDTALRLERVLQIPATLWMNLEVAYRTEHQRLVCREALEDFADWARSFPIREMIQYQFIADVGRSITARVEALLSFFGVTTPKAWDGEWARVQARFRRSPFPPKLPPLTAWLRQSELVAQHIRCEPYSQERFLTAIDAVRSMTVADPKTFCPEATRECANAGVALTFVPSLPGLAISGATRWNGPRRASIHLSLRYRTDDQMWFSFFHEACHVLSHSHNTIFIDDDSAGAQDDPVEIEANQFARDKLVPPEAYAALIRRKPPTQLSLAEVKAFAQQQGVAPGIIVGMLQHDRHWPFSRGNELKKRFKWQCEK